MKVVAYALFENDEVLLLKLTWRQRGRRQVGYEVLFEPKSMYSYLSGGGAEAMTKQITSWRRTAPEEAEVVDTLWHIAMACGPMPLCLH